MTTADTLRQLARSETTAASIPAAAQFNPAEDLRIPLVVDVDGTLLMTDLLHESALRLGATRPALMPMLPVWLARGKAHLKEELASRVPLDPHVPLREEVLDLMRLAKEQGRKVYLASASQRLYVEALATRVGALVGPLDGVFATDKGVNLAGQNKAKELVRVFGAQGFDYVGDSAADLEVWGHARRALVVSRSGRFDRQVRARFPNAQVVASSGSPLKPLFKAMRFHQWAKNLLIFVPMMLAHAFDAASAAAAALGFLAFSLAASSAYVLNDLLDLPNDRRHPSKKRRPFAAGLARLDHGLLLSAGLAAGALALGTLLNREFLMLLGLYYGLTMAYSLVLKRKMLVDVVVLGGLYALRVLAGIAAVDAPQSNWLLLFCFFQFLGLAIAKRITELHGCDANKGAPQGRGYQHGDLRMLMPLGAGAAFGAPLVMGLYVASPDVLVRYSHPSVLWLIAPMLLYWTSRILMLANRGTLHDDPVVFALTDRISWMCGAIIAGLLWAAR